ncbi:nucleotidyltransferase family protein [uncultured Erythrobacter sp.]|uniref:nucleotidyltransferase family protein n=1 Tax=uncultured Erythrobacter sp. TaxID=263913 RepID=UPI0026146191|nr:nucleotidyltransferase family protein [uncultured Erythrobacter sp.]
MGSRRLGVALLAAGSSQRFGADDKLAADFQGKMLAEHAALAIPVKEFEHAWVITRGPTHPCEPSWREQGFAVMINPNAEQGMGTSVSCAARAAVEASLDALLIALADMPLVPHSHFEALMQASTGPSAIAVSAQGDTRMPPAIFGSAHFEALSQSTGDQGAQMLLQQGTLVDCPPEWLKDIDTIKDL